MKKNLYAVKKFTWLVFFCIALATSVLGETVYSLRGDQGPLKDFRPHSAVWLGDDRILMGDIRFNNLQIFDTKGRRFRLFDAASNKGPAQFVGLTPLSEGEFLITGSHYHEKNHPRYRDQRSRLHKFRLDLATESLTLDDFKKNLSPQESLRRTRMWGSSPPRRLKFAGLGVNPRTDTVWFGLALPSSEKGNLSFLKCSLQELLQEKEDLQFTEVDTDFKLPLDERCQQQTYLTDLQVLDDGSLLFLLTADALEGKRLCTNSLWRWVPGSGVKLVQKDLAPNNRATAMAVRSVGKGSYQVALVCDNVHEETELLPSLVLLGSTFKLHP